MEYKKKYRRKIPPSTPTALPPPFTREALFVGPDAYMGPEFYFFVNSVSAA